MLTRGLTALVLFATAPLAAAATLQPGDAAAPTELPPVFRCIFEDRSRMVIIHPPGSDLWVAFNPNTCGVQKIWRGGMDFRGKVWDFSQDNCRASDGARVLLAADPPMALLGDASTPSNGWTLDGVESDGAAGGWRFKRAGASIVSPAFNTLDHSRVIVAFDEASRRAPLRIDVSSDDGLTWTAQSFLSTMHATSDTDWQFNFKLLDAEGPRVRVRLVQTGADDDKLARRIRVFGDAAVWGALAIDHAVPVRPVWRGYERPSSADNGAVCTLLYDLVVKGGEADTVTVRHSFAMAGASGLVETLELAGRSGAARIVHERPRTTGARVTFGGDVTDTRGRALPGFEVPEMHDAVRRITVTTVEDQ